MSQTGEALTHREIAERYCQEQLAIMDGSFEAALQRIGTERFEELVKEIEKTFARMRGDRQKRGRK